MGRSDTAGLAEEDSWSGGARLWRASAVFVAFVAATGCSVYFRPTPPDCGKTGPVIDTLAAAGSGVLGVVFSAASVLPDCGDPKNTDTNCFTTNGEKAAVITSSFLLAAVTTGTAIYGWREHGRCVDQAGQEQKRLARERLREAERIRSLEEEHAKAVHGCRVITYDTTAEPKARAECAAWLEELRLADERAERDRDRQQAAAIETARLEQAERARKAEIWRAYGESMQSKPKTTVVCKPNYDGGQTCVEQ